MGHIIQGMIGSQRALLPVQQRYGRSRVIELSYGVCFLPVTEEFFDAIPDDGRSTEKIEANGFGFLWLCPKLIALLKDASGSESIAYIETEYFGGEGGQGALVAKDGQIVFGPSGDDQSINTALRMIGVKHGDACDEFDTIELGRYRSNEDWLENWTT